MLSLIGTFFFLFTVSENDDTIITHGAGGELSGVQLYVGHTVPDMNHANAIFSLLDLHKLQVIT